MIGVAEYLKFSEYNGLGAINKQFYKELRGSSGAKSCINFIKVRFIDHQPHYTMTFK